MHRPQFFALVAIFASVVSGLHLQALASRKNLTVWPRGVGLTVWDELAAEREKDTARQLQFQADQRALEQAAENQRIAEVRKKTICDVATPVLRSIVDAMRVIHVELAEEHLVLNEDNWIRLDAARSTAENGLERLLALAKGSVVVLFIFLYCRDEENEIRENRV